MSGDREVVQQPVAEPARPETQRRVIRRSSTLTVGAADDPYEREADRVADEVMGVLRRSPDEAPFASTAEAGANGRIRSNPYGPATAGAAGTGAAQRSIQRKSSATSTATNATSTGTSAPVGPTLTDSPGTIRRLGVWDWIWGGTKKVGEGMDTGSATMEAVDGLKETSMLTGGLKTGSDGLGTVGGLIGGSKDLSEGVGSIQEEGLGVGNSMKTVGGTMGILGGINKGVGMVTTDVQKELIEKTIGIGGEALGGWFDFLSGGTKVVSGTYLTGKSQVQYNAVRRIRDGSAVPEVKEAAGVLMEIINESWWMGMWDVGVGTMDMVATTTIPAYAAGAKGVGAVSKMVGGDLLWGTLSWATGGKVRTNDQIEAQIEKKIEGFRKDKAKLLAEAVFRNHDEANLIALYDQAESAGSDFAEAISHGVKQSSRTYLSQKTALRGKVWK